MSEPQPQLVDLASELQRVLSKLITVVRRGDTTSASRPDLTLAQVSILLTLLDSGPIRMTELAGRERVRTPTTTVAIRRLEKLGLVSRSRDPSDMRAVLVEVSERFQDLAVVASREADRRAEFEAIGVLTVAAPALDHDVSELTSLLELGGHLMGDR